jgi:hypothetical protein
MIPGPRIRASNEQPHCISSPDVEAQVGRELMQEQKLSFRKWSLPIFVAPIRVTDAVRSLSNTHRHVVALKGTQGVHSKTHGNERADERIQSEKLVLIQDGVTIYVTKGQPALMCNPTHMQAIRQRSDTQLEMCSEHHHTCLLHRCTAASRRYRQS